MSSLARAWRRTLESATGVKLANGTFLPAELVVWAAGVKAPDLLRNLDGLETNRINQLLVLPTLRTTHDENIFARSATVRPAPGRIAPKHMFRPVPKLRTSRQRTW